MAASTLVLNVPQLVTTSNSSGKLREIILPIGMSSLKMSSNALFYIQVTGSDEGDQTAAAQFMYPAGVYMEPFWSLGEPIMHPLRATVSIYAIGNSTAQSIWFHAVSR